MKNLAGNPGADKFIKEELYLAGISPYSIGKIESEVPYTIIGRFGKWTFRRAWTYWVASVEKLTDGLPLRAALELHEKKYPTDETKILGQSIRSGGHCGCPSPADYGADPEYNEDLNNQLKALGYKEKEDDFLEKSYIPISVGEVSKLCNEGKLTVKRYVSLYHIDDQIGLNEFVNALRYNNCY